MKYTEHEKRKRLAEIELEHGQFTFHVDIEPEHSRVVVWVGSELFEDWDDNDDPIGGECYPDCDLTELLIESIDNQVNGYGELDKAAVDQVRRMIDTIEATIAKYEIVDIRQKYGDINSG